MKNKIIALTGAGISKASGVPTFVEMGDLRDKLSRWYFESNPEDFYRVLLTMKETTDQASPNPAHYALARYQVPIITMNIDGLHQRAGTREIIEIHGGLGQVRCHCCGTVYPFHVIKDSISCSDCGQVYDTEVVLYGDGIPHFGEAVQWILGAEKLLIVGTSFYTSTSSELARIAKGGGVEVTVINERAEIEVEAYLQKHLKD